MTAALALKADDTVAVLAAAAREGDAGARQALADVWLERGRPDVARLYLDRLPREELALAPGKRAPRLRKRIDKLTEKERAQMAGWAEKWTAIGLSTQPADKPLFEAGVRACYRRSELAEPKAVVWCPNPLVVALAGPLAHAILAGQKLTPAPSAVGSAVGEQIARLPRDVFYAPDNEWYRYIGGQFWVGWYYWYGPASVAFVLDVLRLDVGRDIELRARAFAACCMSACWFWPHTHFVLVSERPRRLEKYANGTLKVVEWDGWKVEK